MWAYDRLSDDFPMDAKELGRTALEIRKVLEGKDSVAARYEPNEWDPSAQISEIRDTGNE